jgi:YihY family inner membrane protein
VSVATTVPETNLRRGDNAREQIRRTGLVRLLVEAAKRFHAADGTSYGRAVGLASLLSLIPALIGTSGLAATFGLDGFRLVLGDTARSIAPGPAGDVLTEALRPHATGPTALVFGLAVMLASGTVAMIQLERGANRVYGVDEDRSILRRHVVAFIMAATVGVLLIGGLVVIAAGGAVGDAARARGVWTGSASDLWSVLRWPIGVALVGGAMTLVFHVVPNRRQPKFSWLLSGTTVAVSLWIGLTLLLALFYEHARGLGDTYGPLLGVMALLLWSYLTGAAVLCGLAFAAQLESERAGTPEPTTEEELPAGQRESIEELSSRQGR